MMLYDSRTGLLYYPSRRERACAANYRDNGTGKPIFKKKGHVSMSVLRDPTYNKDGPPTKEQLKQVKTLAKAIQDDYILDNILKENT